jgi:hypothetical protein
MKAYYITHNGAMVPGTKIYPTIRGAKLGFKCFLTRVLQKEYLRPGKNYNHMIAWWRKNPSFTPGVAEVQKRFEELCKEYTLKEVDMV